ncbi:PAS domain S-box protein [Methanoculleus frigidifontis]|uniref:PAS domain S-box protein n=1 Tax=Methanoculleus frigidifontis TaxID=2584085 RepID=UPI002658246E|nr:PAS domain S-box protein [Methanoculleus sp. FWC-SCC1]
MTSHLIDELPCGVVYTDERQAIRFVNRVAEALLGIHRNRVLGMPAGAFFTRYVAPHLTGEGMHPEEIADALRSGRDVPATPLLVTGTSGRGCRAEYASRIVGDGALGGARLDTYTLPGAQERRASSGVDRDLFASMLENAPYALLLVDADGKCLYANRTFTGITAYTTEDVPDLARWFARAHPNPAYRTRVLETWDEQIIRNRVSASFSVVCRDGRIREIEIRATELDYGMHLLTLLDVTERTAVAEQLVQTAAELQAVIDAFPDLYLRVNFDGTILDFRMGEATDLEVAPQFLLGRRLRDILPEETALTLQTAIVRVLDADAPASLEFALPITGGQRSFEARLVPLRERQLMVILRDITERRCAEEELRRYREHLEELVQERTAELEAANQQLRRLLHYIEMTERKAAEDSLRQCDAICPDDSIAPEDGVITTDLAGEIVLINAVAEDLTGFSREEATGRTIDDVVVLIGEDSRDLFAAGAAEKEAVIAAKDGSHRTVILAGEPVLDADGAAIGFILTLRAIR